MTSFNIKRSFYSERTCLRGFEKMTTSSDLSAQKVIIKYCVDRGLTPVQTKMEMDCVGGPKKVSRTLVYTWHKKFREGLDMESTSGRGRPKKDNSALVKKVRDVIDADRRQTVREVASKVGACKTVVHRVLCDNLEMSRVSARWVPRLLSNEEMIRRVESSKMFLKKNNRDKRFLDKVITMDETWLHYYEPESKRQSSVWKTHGTPPPKKAKTVKSVGKVMYMVFMDRQGIILSHAVPRGSTINSEYYLKVTIKQICCYFCADCLFLLFPFCIFKHCKKT